MQATHYGRYNLIAAFTDVPAAQRAVERLRVEGIKSHDITLLERGQSETARAKNNDGDCAAIAGGEPVAFSALSSVVGARNGIEGGGGIGAIAAIGCSEDSSAACETYLAQGHVVVGVHSDNVKDAHQAELILVRQQPLALDRVALWRELV